MRTKLNTLLHYIRIGTILCINDIIAALCF